MALSRQRDTWILVGAAGVGFILLGAIIISLFIYTKRKRTQSAISAPQSRRVLQKDEEYAPTTSGIDNTAYTSETDGRVSNLLIYYKCFGNFVPISNNNLNCCME